MSGKRIPGSGPRPDTRLAICGAWSGANATMSAVFRTTEFYPNEEDIKFQNHHGKGG